MLIEALCKKFGIKEEELNFRVDGRIEWVCEHGVGHTIYSENDNYIHGCCGCCSKIWEYANGKD